jgi:hypothetical protein
MEPLAKSGAVLPFPLSRLGSESSDARPMRLRKLRAKRLDALKHDNVQHNFAVRALERTGFFRRRVYIYLCVRCRQIFVVNHRGGLVVAVDRERNPLPEPQHSNQVKAFDNGPCPGFKLPARAPHHGDERAHFRKQAEKKIDLVASMFEQSAGGQGYQAAIAITPLDLLS